MTHLDHAILILYMGAVLLLGWRLRLRAGEGAVFFLAARRMGWLPIGLSVMVTVFSAINYLALPNEVFGHGLYVIVALPIFFLAAWPVVKIWMPFFHRLELTSVYAYLERRFDARVRALAGAVFVLWRLFWMATALFASAGILSLLTGLPTPLIIVLGGVVATAYTLLGGMRAVMWTDVLQFSVLFGGIALGVSLAAGEMGLGGILDVARQGGRLRPFVPFDPQFLSLDPTLRMTLWSGTLGVFVAFMSRYGADQVVMQRYFSARSLQAAQKGLWLNAAVSVLALGLLAIFGLAVYAKAVAAGAFPENWEALPQLKRNGFAMKQLAAVIRDFPAGITGLVVAGLMAATMSSVDSGINACSAVWLTDLRPGTGAGQDRRNRRLTLLFGLAATGLALGLIPLIGKQASLFGVVNRIINGLGSPLLALMVLGMFSRRVNAPGMLVGGIIGLVGSVAASLFLKPLALQYYAVFNLLVCLAACYLASLVAARRGYIQRAESLAWMWRRRKTDP